MITLCRIGSRPGWQDWCNLNQRSSCFISVEAVYSYGWHMRLSVSPYNPDHVGDHIGMQF